MVLCVTPGAFSSSELILIGEKKKTDNSNKGYTGKKPNWILYKCQDML